MENKDKKYYITDIESGHTSEVTKKQHEVWQKMWQEAMSLVNVDKTKLSKVIITGTAGDLYNHEFETYKNLWLNPTKDYKFTTFENNFNTTT